MSENNQLTSILPLQPTGSVQLAAKNLRIAVNKLIDRFNLSKAEIIYLQTEFDKFRNIRPDTELIQSTLRNRIDELESQNSEFNEIFNEYEIKLASYEELKLKFEQLEDENSELRKDYDELGNSKVALLSELNQNKEIDAKILTQDNLIELLENEIQNLKSNLELKDDEIANFNFEENEKKIAELQHVIYSLEKQLHETESINIELKDSLQNQKADFDSQFSKLEREKFVLKNEIQNLIEENQILHSDSDLLKSKDILSQSTLEDIDLYQKQIAELTAKLSILEERNFELTNQHQSFSRQAQILTEQEEQIKILSSELNDSTKNVEKYKKLYQDFNDKESQSFELFSASEIEEKDDKIAALHQEIFELHNKLASIESEHTILKLQLDDRKEQVPVLESTSNDLELYEEIKYELINELKALKTEIGEMELQIDEARKLNSELEKTISLLRHQIENKDDRLTELLQFESEFHQNQKEILDLKSSLNSLSQLVTKTNQEKIDQENKIFTLLKEKNSASAKLIELEQSIETMEVTVSEKEKIIKVFETSVKKSDLKERDREQDKMKIIFQINKQVTKLNGMIK